MLSDILILRLEKKTTMVVSDGLNPLAGYLLLFYSSSRPSSWAQVIVICAAYQMASELF